MKKLLMTQELLLGYPHGNGIPVWGQTPVIELISLAWSDKS
jgi:hypothetical protein